MSPALCASLRLLDPLTVSGPARVIDGDTVAVGEIHVRLKGVDARRARHGAGDAATAAMQVIVGNSELHCTLTGEKTWKRDVGFCFTSDGVDIKPSHHRQARRWPARATAPATCPMSCRKPWRSSSVLRTACCTLELLQGAPHLMAQEPQSVGDTGIKNFPQSWPNAWWRLL